MAHIFIGIGVIGRCSHQKAHIRFILNLQCFCVEIRALYLRHGPSRCIVTYVMQGAKAMRQGCQFGLVRLSWRHTEARSGASIVSKVQHLGRAAPLF